MVYEFHQDDPKKCTAARLRKFGMIKSLQTIKQIPPHALVLNPTATKTLSSVDRTLAEQNGIVALDCSWNRSQDIFVKPMRGEGRRLPALLAGNPTNYSVLGKLSTAEAIAATLFIIGYREEAVILLSPFNWGETFLALNKEPLEEYAESRAGEIFARETEFFGSESD